MAGKLARRIYNSRRWRRLREVKIGLTGHRCERCGLRGALEVHHRKRLADGGAAYALENLETVCRECHLEQGVIETKRTDRDLLPEVPPEDLAWGRHLAELAHAETHITTEVKPTC